MPYQAALETSSQNQPRHKAILQVAGKEARAELPN